MTQPARNLALDVFRGMTVCFMIIVNSAGSWSFVYDPLEHASWHGFTPTDLVFPSFLFAVGNAMAFVMHKYESQGNNVFWKKTLKRTFLIFLFGFLMYWFPFVEKTDAGWIISPLSNTRILGVLQRIALCYFFASVILHFGSRNFALIFSGLALVGYWIIMYVYGDPNDPFSLIGNAQLKLDLAILGDKHLYHGEGIAFDPEGILSTLPAIVNVIGGFMVGDYIRKHGNTFETISKLMIAGGVLILVALTWDMAFPINKKLWTSSFVLLTIGLDLAILAALIYFYEISKVKKGSYFFLVFGRNPWFIYFTSEIFLILMLFIKVGDISLWGSLFIHVFKPILSPTFGSFLMAFTWMMANWLMGYALDKRKIYIKV
jgi:predicted acyltransferase